MTFAIKPTASHAVLTTNASPDVVEQWIASNAPGVIVLSIGKSIDLYKDIGAPAEIARRYEFAKLQGTHLVGHTRMATESAVTPAHAHPFTAGHDFCLVHNGSLSNPNLVRRKLEPLGITFETDNDTEAACRYFEWRLREGDDLPTAVRRGFDELDGFYTFLMGTDDQLALVRDAFACKPAIVAETDDYVAVASEFRGGALAGCETGKVVRAKTAGGVRMENMSGEQGQLVNWPLAAGQKVDLREFDLAKRTVRELNHYLHRELAPTGNHKVIVSNPDGAHSIACGMNAAVDIEINGHVGYYVAGMNKYAHVVVNGNAGPGAAENMMSGLVRVRGFASTSAGASARGGCLVIEGDASLRCGISLKGADIVVGGSVGSFSAFMAQAGRMVICGDAGDALGDSLYEAVIYLRGEARSLGADARYEEMSAADLAAVNELLAIAGLNYPSQEFRRIASARSLYHWNADANQEY